MRRREFESASAALDTGRGKARKPPGRHPDKRLTAVGVRAAKAPGRYADGNGLYLVVDGSGAKRWLWRGVIKGKRCDLGLGSVQLVPLAEARDEAVGLRRRARKGDDPLAERRCEQRVVPTFKAAALEVHASHGAAFKNVKHRAQWIATLETYAFPVFGERAVDQVSSADVLKALAPIWSAKPETARRVKQRIRLVFHWAKASQFRSGDNPTDNLTQVLPQHNDRKVHHAALPYQQVPAFLVTLREADAAELVRLAFELAILTALRTSEVLRARWPEVDLEAAVWTVPGPRMKMGFEHRVPLSPRAVEIFRRAKTLSDGSAVVFPGRRLGKPLSNMAFLMLLRRLKLETITPHGFRSSFRDWCGERTNTPHAVCEAALAHKVKDATEAAYHRTDYFDRRRTLMDAWEHFATAAPAAVVPMRA